MKNTVTFNITYNGKPYKNFGDALKHALQDKVSEGILKRLSPLADEIKKEGGSITIDFDDNYQPTITLHDMSPDLSAKSQLLLKDG